MKIAFIGGRDIHVLGGIENYMYNLATQLVKMGHEPIVFCESDHNGEEIVNGFRVIHQKSIKSNFLCKPILGLRATWKVVRAIRDIDGIHYNAWPPSLWSPLATLFGVKSLMQGHGLEWKRSKYSNRQKTIMKFMEWFTAHLNRNLIMCSDDQRVYFKKHYNRDSVTIPTAVNLPNSSKEKTNPIFTKYGISPNKYFLFLARLVQDKNPDYLIKAYLRNHPVGYKLVIAGDNPSDTQYVEYLHNLTNNYGGDVVFTGAVYGKDKESLLSNAFAYCIPSTIEGLSISLLEAMSYKLRIIASDIPSNREILEPYRAVWVKPECEDDLENAFDLCIGNDDKWQETVDYNYRVVEDKYTWEKVAAAYIKYWNLILDKK